MYHAITSLSIKSCNYFRRKLFSLPFPNSIIESYMPSRVSISAPVKLSHSIIAPSSGYSLSVNSYTSIGACSYLGPSLISIGKYCSLAPFVFVGAPEHDYADVSTSSALNPEWIPRRDRILFHDNTKRVDINLPKTIIEHDVWIGVNSFIKSGITLHTGCVIGANSVVLRDVPPYTIVAGAPAKLLRKRFSHSLINHYLNTIDWDSELCTPAYLKSIHDSISHNGEIHSSSLYRYSS